MVEKKPAITGPRRRKRLKKDNTLRITFGHGLGDALMFRLVLLQMERPVKLLVPRACRYIEVFRDIPHVEATETKFGHRQHYEVRFYPEDSGRECKGGPTNKTRICLEHEFQIFDSSIKLRPKPLDWATLWGKSVWESLAHIDKPYIVFHGQAGSSPERKSCSPWMAHQIQDVVHEMGYKLVVLNYDFSYRVNAVPDYWWIGLHDSVSTKGWPLGALPMWHILNQAVAFIGIDSGPLHLALTIPRLPCMFIKNQIDFMTQFYDGGLEQIRHVVDYDTPIAELRERIKNLPSGKAWEAS